ncbi:helix-turn-helix domain-containing protein [Paramicrobacterium chengjingii]|uniref:Helix-turn-helix transcriptional regulator n=1 Tax=Paramicrobacterium chengjingii TaxID=2769067 RepID=A0ABX6YLC9_9MICO|nr:helix-turn-helix transcriptional regulator [Microbacterium chengjingii]QPZ39522.1 helix-turn-helix transcriptional regulator [Microbacterium chengjingii]
MSVLPSEGIGKRLAEYRRLAGLSARELAERAGAGLSRGVIANIESGRKADLTVDQLIAVCAVLGIPPSALALPVDQPKRFVRLSGQNADSVERRTVRSWAALEWFHGGNWVLDSDDGRPNAASTLSRAIAEGVREYVKYHVASAANIGHGTELENIEKGLKEAEENLRKLGVDLTDYKIDE